MKKILWLCNVVFTEETITHTGSWLQPLAVSLQNSGEAQIYNVAYGNTAKVLQNECSGIRQWIIPERTAGYGQVASTVTCEEVCRIESIVKPDLIHIWGTESSWASIYRMGYLKAPTLLDMQGLLYVYADYFYGGLTFAEIIRCIGLKELLMPWRTLFWKKRIFKKRGRYEVENIRSLPDISCQSEWVKRQLSVIHPSARYHDTKIILRDEFYAAKPWRYKMSGAPVIFSMCSAAVSYKGLHVLLKATGILKKKYPSIRLNLAGTIDVGNKLLDGYSIFLKKLIKQLDLADNVRYLGPLNAGQIVHCLQECSVCAVPSFIETYCLAFAEAMIVGAPTVASYAGAMPDLACHKESALFYNSSDCGMCAAYMDMLIQDGALAESLSAKARENRLKNNNPDAVVETQLNIYRTILNTP